MDNDDLRHGKPTNHKVYGEAIATLAGDALVTDAFAVVARSPFAKKYPELVLEVIAELSDAAGSGGMVSGQVIDLIGEGRAMNLEQLEYLHSKKTGALFLASVVGGARLGGAASLHNSTRCRSMRERWDSASRSSTIFSTSKLRPSRWASAPTRTRPPARTPIRC